MVCHRIRRCGSFSVSVTKSLRSRFGWIVAPCFVLTIHKRDLALLQEIQRYFGGIGHLKLNGDLAYYVVSSKSQLAIIIAHFRLFPLLSSKKACFHILR
jgi:hypothetical protein